MDDDDYQRELALDKSYEQEPRRTYRGPRNPTERNEEARERLAGFGGAVVETASQDEAADVRVFGFWRPSDRSGS